MCDNSSTSWSYLHIRRRMQGSILYRSKRLIGSLLQTSFEPIRRSCVLKKLQCRFLFRRQYSLIRLRLRCLYALQRLQHASYRETSRQDVERQVVLLCRQHQREKKMLSALNRSQLHSYPRACDASSLILRCVLLLLC